MKHVRIPVVLGTLATICIASRLTHGWFFVATPLWLLAPGYLVERYLHPLASPRPLLIRVTLWLSLSLGLVPLVYLWTTTLGLVIAGPAILVTTALLALGVAYYGWQDLVRVTLPQGSGEWAMPLLLLLALVLTAWKRIHEIAGLAFPPWVDAVHHALMIRVVWETGKAPFSLQPYLPIDHFAYHWGYHAFAATLLHLTDLSLPLFMLWFGQLLAICYVVVLGSLAYALWGRPLAAVVAGAVGSLISLMPAYYLSWGRYTLLAGLLLVPGIMLASVEMVHAGSWRSVTLLTLLLSGVSLIHIVAFALALVWCAALWLVQPGGLQQMGRTLRRFMLVGGITLLLTAPWISFLIHQTTAVESKSSPLSIVGGGYNAMPWDLLWVPGNRMLVVAAMIGAYLGLRRRSRAALAVLLWVLLVLCCANPVWFGLPYLSFFNNRIVVLALFLPASMLIAGGTVVLDDMVRNWLEHPGLLQRRANLNPSPPCGRGWSPQRLGEGAGARDIATTFWLTWPLLRAALLAAGLLWSASVLLPKELVLNQGLAFAGPADLAAITWVAQHTPVDARFAINSEGWLYDMNRGSDGGWWLLPLAGRQVSTPPVIFTYGTAAYVKAVKQLTAELRDAAGESPAELAVWMDHEHFEYAYATSGGRIFDRDRLRGSPLFEELYHNDSVSIFHRKF